MSSQYISATATRSATFGIYVVEIYLTDHPDVFRVNGKPVSLPGLRGSKHEWTKMGDWPLEIHLVSWDPTLFEVREIVEPQPCCQFCLSNPRHTRLGSDPHRRCPVCGADYSGPRRAREFQILLEAGLVFKGTAL
jgi:hypothetical protein